MGVDTMMRAGGFHEVIINDDDSIVWSILDAAEEVSAAKFPEQNPPAIGYIPSDPGLCFSGLWATVGDELAKLCLVHNCDYQKVVKKFDMEHLVESHFSDLSGGESILVAIALASIARPKTWVLDRCFEWLDVEKMAWFSKFFEEEVELGSCVLELCQEAGRLGADLGKPNGEQSGKDVLERNKIRRHLPCLDNSIKFSNLEMSYGGKFKLGPISLNLEMNKAYALVGKNGSGKTSFAMAVAGLVSSSGTVICQTGLERTNLQNVCYAFQNPDRQIFRTTVQREVSEIAERRGTHDSKYQELIMETLGLAQLSKADPLRLTLSQRRLVTIASALVSRSDLIVLDEPTAFLSGQQVARLLTAIEIATKNGGTLIAITHDYQFARKLNSVTLYMDDGKLNTVGG